MLKRFKNLEYKADNQLDLIKSQGINKEINKFYDGIDEEILELQKKAINESIENIIDENKVFNVKINDKTY